MDEGCEAMGRDKDESELLRERGSDKANAEGRLAALVVAADGPALPPSDEESGEADRQSWLASRCECRPR